MRIRIVMNSGKEYITNDLGRNELVKMLQENNGGYKGVVITEIMDSATNLTRPVYIQLRDISSIE